MNDAHHAADSPIARNFNDLLDDLRYWITVVGDGATNGSPQLAIALQKAWDTINAAVVKPPGASAVPFPTQDPNA
jgi:hypothetical protein